MTQLVQAKEQLKGTGFFFVRIDALSGGYPSHAHDYVEIVIVLEGEARHIIDERSYLLHPGDVYVVRGNTMHGFERPSRGFRIANVMYLPDAVSFPFGFLNKLPGYQALFVIEPAKRLEGEFKSMLRLDGMGMKEALSKIHDLKREMEEGEPGYESMLQAKLLELVVMLSRAYSKSPRGGGGKILRLGEAIAWMEGNCLKPVSLPEMARRAMMSERHFLRQFRKAFDCSPMEHVIRLRVRHACSLLKRGGVSIGEAAFASGFNDSNYFSRQFKRTTGLSPKEYAQMSTGARFRT